MTRTVGIRPGVSMLSVLRHLNYKPWYALAEFVDNAVESYRKNADRIRAADGQQACLRVAVRLGTDADPRIIVRDNAAGIAASEYERAFKAAEVPPDTGGLSEFGMGMKSAACWFARKWHVRSAALGEGIERTVSFDIASIVGNKTEELVVVSATVPKTDHYTEVVLDDVYKPPQGRTRGKIRDHLASIYRVFIRDGSLELLVDEERLEFESPAVLRAPFHKTPQGRLQEWRKDLDFDFGDGLRARGFAALRERGSTSDAGFALFRRSRLIEGSNEDGYRPEFIFGKSNSYRYQRLFGELELNGFGVSHTKDGFQWQESEETFLELLRDELDADPLPLLQQAEEFRALRSREELAPAASVASKATAASIADIAPTLERLAGETPVETPREEAPEPVLTHREATLRFRDEEWTVVIETTNDPAVGDCIEVVDDDARNRRICVRVSLAHRFTQKWVGNTAKEIEPFLRLATALGLAEVTAHLAGVRYAGTVRRNMNELLSHSLTES